MLGLETALALALTELDLPVERVLALMSWQPARIARVDTTHGRPVAEGSPANICVFSPHQTWLVDAAALASRSSNTPFDGMKLEGKVRHTIFNGEVVVSEGQAQR
jgi:dihydroorotase